MWAGILSFAAGLFGLLGKVMDRWFAPKTPEEKERERIADENEARRDALTDVHNAIDKAEDSKGDTSDIEDLLNR